MKKNWYRRGTALVLALCVLLSCASCGGGTSAATMRLHKMEGTVAVSDGEGKRVEPKENLGLFSGYGVDTQAESYAWVNLDSVKLTKLDENSAIEIVKEDKRLTIEVKSGSLFFNVTEPLADDESLDIRTSTMAVGIRGTCGWVTEETAFLLEGTVTVTAGEQAAQVSAGEMARVSGDGTLTVEKFTAADIPAFVQEEISGTDNTELADTLELLRQRAERVRPLESIAYYGNPANCALTAEQAEELIRIIEERSASAAASYGNEYEEYLGSFAALFDPGCGVPAVIFTIATLPDWAETGTVLPNKSAVLYYKDGVLTEFEANIISLDDLILYDDHLILGFAGGGNGDYEVYPFEDGQISGEPVTTYSWNLEYLNTPFIDGVGVSQEEYDRWREKWWGVDYLVSIHRAPDRSSGNVTGLSPAEDVAAALNNFLHFS